MSSKQKKIALICPTCGARQFARPPRMCGSSPQIQGAHVHPLIPMVSAALYHSRKASGVNPNPTPLQKPEASR